MPSALKKSDYKRIQGRAQPAEINEPDTAVLSGPEAGHRRPDINFYVSAFILLAFSLCSLCLCVRCRRETASPAWKTSGKTISPFKRYLM
ncbi:MAG: hypothetical protein DRI57_20035 [Deltaproteobacteria bacterium]|nr:MAG: hypothetical protein DRI57_20035 [Deltaproteobacteria bacterium]